jgi:hypothetical protein
MVSVDDLGNQGNNHSLFAAISSDGRFVAFQSLASDLVVGDTNIATDVFLHDRQTGLTERVSLADDGSQALNGSYVPDVSGDGRHVAFYSDASNLVAGDTNGKRDVFVRDRVAGATDRVSVSGAGTQGNGESSHPSLAADGRFAAFQSLANNLVTGDTNGAWDIFVRDRDDDDGLPWTYENERSCLVPTVPDASADPDVDLLDSGTELGIGTEPCVNDTDTDGCADGEELGPNEFLGGRRDPLSPWDFFDVPLPVGEPGTGSKDKGVDIADALGALAKFGSVLGDPVPGAPKYDPAYDRTSPSPDPWDTQAPDGVVDLYEFFWAIAQFGHTCFPAP